ncbi:MAG: hypothetical protein QM689_09850 [Oscillospiraceae bacterium]
MEAYRVPEAGAADVTFSVTKRGMDAVFAAGETLTEESAEYILTGAEFAGRILRHGAFALHSSAVVYRGRAVLFSAPSGTGKSTHTALWLDRFGADAYILNDDKPVIRREGDCLFAYGTPWSGKTRLNRNLRVPLHAVVFLTQSPDNRIAPMSTTEAVKMLYYQAMRCDSSPRGTAALLDLIGDVAEHIPLFRLHCNMNPDAAQTAFRALFPEQSSQTRDTEEQE